MPCHGTKWTSLLSFLYPLHNWQCSGAKCSCFWCRFLFTGFCESGCWKLHGTSPLLLGPCAVQALTFSLPSLKFFPLLFISYSTVSHWLANDSSSCLQFPVCGFPFLTQLIFLSQRWRHLVPIKLWHVSTCITCITFQNVIICMQRISFTLSKCNNLDHCFHNIEEKISSNDVIFSGSFLSNTKWIIKHVYSSVVDTTEGIFLTILIWHTNGIPFTHVVSCHQFVSEGTLHEDQCMFFPEARIPFDGFSWQFLSGTLTIFPSHILFLQ